MTIPAAHNAQRQLFIKASLLQDARGLAPAGRQTFVWLIFWAEPAYIGAYEFVYSQNYQGHTGHVTLRHDS